MRNKWVKTCKTTGSKHNGYYEKMISDVLFFSLSVNTRKEQGESNTRFVLAVPLNVHCLP